MSVASLFAMVLNLILPANGLSRYRGDACCRADHAQAYWPEWPVVRWHFLAWIGISVALLGCGKQAETVSDDKPSPEVKVQGPLRVMIVDDRELGTILEREWSASSEHAIEIEHVEPAILRADLESGAKRLETDVVIFPSAMLGTLAENKLLRPAPRELTTEPTYRYGEIFDLPRRRETRWGAQTYALSFGSPTLVLLRRTDLVPEAPGTWADLSREIERLNGSGLPDDMMALAQPLADGWAARTLLARAAGYLFDSSKVSDVFNYATMEPRITSDAFVRALDEMTADCTKSPSFDMTPATALQTFMDGRAAMAITWATAFSSGPDEGRGMTSVAISDLPGAVRSADDASGDGEASGNGPVTLFGIDGRLGSVSRSAKNAALANIFLAWATGPEQSQRIGARSTHTAPFRRSHQAKPGVWAHASLPATAAEEYAQVLQQALCRSRAFQYLRIPGANRYMSVLDEKVLDTLHSRQPARPALDEVAEKWVGITEEIGASNQKAAYRRSLGIDSD